MTISLYSAQMLHWLHFRQQRASLWTPPSTRNVTFSVGKRTFMKLRSHDKIALFAQMLQWPHFRQSEASFWTPWPQALRSLKRFTGGSLGTQRPCCGLIDCIVNFTPVLHWLLFRQQRAAASNGSACYRKFYSRASLAIV